MVFGGAVAEGNIYVAKNQGGLGRGEETGFCFARHMGSRPVF